MFEILSNERLADQVFRMVLKAPQIAKKRKAGQFVILRIDDKGERIPLTIADGDPAAGTITLIYQEVGATTHRLSTLGAGDHLENLVGPLGLPTHILDYGHAVCVAGGVGTAVIYPITRALKEAGNKVSGIIGARNKDLIILESEMEEVTDRLEISTDDGSAGTKGFVSDVLQRMIDEGQKIDFVMAIGPVPMMRAVVNVTRPHGIKTMVSLNPIMVDGTGMCGGCRVSIAGQSKFACVDGPDFDGFDVDFDELTKRLRMYTELEKASLERVQCASGN